MINLIYMFIKRINKIYAPPKPALLNQKKAAISPQQPQSQIKAKENLSQVSDISLKVLFMCVDPHARLICLYCQQFDTIYIISILTLLNYINNFRQEFGRTKQYSFKQSLKPELIIQNPRPSLHIFQIKFSHSVQGTQFLVVAYYSGVIDVYSVVTGKRIDGLDIAERSLQSCEGLSPIYNVNVIGHSIFISTYDGKLLCYQGRELGPCLKFQDQWVRLCYDFKEINQESHEGNKLSKREEGRKLKRAPLYQDKNNLLRLGNRLIQKKQYQLKNKEKQAQKKSRPKSKEKEKERKSLIEQPTLTQSYQQYLRLENQKVGPEGEHNKYSLSLCERFLICRNEAQLILDNQYICSIFYTIRSREESWEELDQPIFCHPPVINQFWGIGSGTKSSKSKEQHNFMEYCLNSRQMLVATVGNYEYQDNKLVNYDKMTDQRSISVIKLSRNKNNGSKMRANLMSRVVQAKEDIIQIRWIGPNMLLYLGQTGNLYYVQINPSLLID